MNLICRLLVISFFLLMATACFEKEENRTYPDVSYSSDNQEADYSGSYFDSSVDVFITPQLKIIGRGPVVPLQNQSLPISTINIKEVELELFYVHEPGKYLSKNKHYIDKGISSRDLSRQNESLSSVFLERYRIENVRTNEDIRSRISLPRNLKEGWYFARMRQVNNVNDYTVFPLHITSLGSHLSYLPGESTADLFVTNVQTGQRLNSGFVRTYRNGRVVGPKYLIEDGKAKIKLYHDDLYTIVSSSNDGKNVAIISPKEVPLDLSEFDIDGRSYTPVDAFIYASRDLVKSGESLLVSVLVRDDDGQDIELVPLYLTLRKPDGQVDKIKVEPGEIKGHYRYEIEVPQDAPVGLYKLEARVNPYADKLINAFQFQVQEFAPERMDMQVELAFSRSQVHQQNHLSLAGRYLFGAPANGNKADVTVTSKAVRFPSDTFKNYVVGIPFNLDRRFQQLPELTLDSKGAGQTFLPKLEKQISAPVESIVTVVLKDKGATGAQRKARYVTHPSKKYVAVKKLTDNPSYYSNVDFDMAIVDIEGDRMAEGDLKVELYRHTGSYFWTYSELSGWQSHDQPNPWQLEQEYALDTNQGSVVSAPVKWGKYKLVGTSEGAQRVEYEFYVGWDSANSLSGVRPGMLDISYAKGQPNQNDDSVRVSFTPNLNGSAIVNLVADKVLWSKSINTRIGELSSLDIPNKWRRHDLYVSVVNVGSDAQESSKREIGVKFLKLNRDSRKLTVNSVLPEKIVPNTNMSFPVRVSSMSGAHQGAKFTVSLVDKGITNITGYHGKNPFDYFYAQQRYGFDHIDLYGRIFDQTADPFLTPKFGGDVPGAKNNVASELVESKTIVLDSQVIQTDMEGKAEVSFEIPDYNGEAQVVVTAFNEDSFGMEEQDVIIADDYVAELNIPKFLAPGDKTSAFVSLHNLSGRTAEFKARLTSSEFLRLTPKTDQYRTFELSNSQFWNEKVFIEIPKNTSAKTADFSLEVITPEGRIISRNWTVPVRHVAPYKSQGHSIVLSKGGEYIVDPALFEGFDSFDASVRVSMFPDIPVQSIAEGLFSYPYGCGEQTISRANAWLLSGNELETEKQKVLTSETSEKDILAQAIQNVQKFKKTNGSFGLWSSDSEEDPWLSVYITDFLLKVEDRFSSELIAADSLKPHVNRLKFYVRNGRTDVTPHPLEALAYRSYAAYVLAKEGEVTRSDVAKVEKEFLPLAQNNSLATVYIAGAYAWLGDKSRAAELLDINTFRRSDDYFDDYGSDVRDLSLAVNVLDELHKKQILEESELKSKLYLELIDKSKSRNYLSTQERIALIGAAAVTREQGSFFDFTYGYEFVRTKTPVIKDASHDSSVINDNDFPLFVSANVFGLPKGRESEVNGLRARHKRTLFKPDGTLFTNDSIKVGQRIVVVNEVIYGGSINNAMVVDLVPGGFVLENPELNQSIDTSHIKYTDFYSTKRDLDAEFNMTEYRTDRYVMSHDLLGQNNRTQSAVYSYVLRAEVPGDYQLPPSYLEDMYKPYNFYISYGDRETITVE